MGLLAAALPGQEPDHLRGNLLLCSVWYLDRDRQRQPAVVMALDVTHPPPAYCIRLEGADGTRDTEEARLQPRAAQPLPAPGLSASEAKSAAGEPEGFDRSGSACMSEEFGNWRQFCTICDVDALLRHSTHFSIHECRRNPSSCSQCCRR